MQFTVRANLNINIINSIQTNTRIDSEYYLQKYIKVEKLLNKLHCVKLSNISEGIKCGPFGSTITKGSYREAGIPLLRVGNTSGMFVDVDNLVFLDEALLDKLEKYIVSPGDIVVSQRGTVAQFAKVTEAFSEWVISANLISIPQPQQIDADYLLAFLNSRYGMAQVLRLQSGQVQPKIVTGDIRSIDVFMPDASKQKEIGDLVRYGYAAQEKSREIYREAKTLLLALLGLDGMDLSPQLSYTATFEEVEMAERLDAQYFQPQYTNVIRHLSQNFVVEQMEQWGKVLKGRSVKYTDIGRGIPIVRSGDLTDLNSAEHFKIALTDQSIFYLQKNDICISSIGFGSIGKVQVFDKEGQHGTVSEVTVVRQDRVNPYYLQVYLQSIAGQLQIEQWITGATGQLHLYPRDVGKIFVPIIPIEQQNKFERLVMESHSAQNEAKQLLGTAKQRVEQMILGGEA